MKHNFWTRNPLLERIRVGKLTNCLSKITGDKEKHLKRQKQKEKAKKRQKKTKKDDKQKAKKKKQKIKG